MAWIETTTQFSNGYYLAWGVNIDQTQSHAVSFPSADIRAFFIANDGSIEDYDTILSETATPTTGAFPISLNSVSDDIANEVLSAGASIASAAESSSSNTTATINTFPYVIQIRSKVWSIWDTQEEINGQTVTVPGLHAFSMFGHIRRISH